MSGATEHILGNVSFGPAPTLWEEQPTLRELYEQACAGLVRAECENDELRAEVALLREEQAILKRQFAGVIEGRAGDIPGRSDLSPRTTLEETVQEFREGLFFGEASK